MGRARGRTPTSARATTTRTAQLSTDVGLFTCNPEITDDVADLFNFLTGRSPGPVLTLLVARSP
jgi:polyphosphate kinase